MSRTHDDDETIRKRSAWIVPLGVFVVTCALGAIVAFFYYIEFSAPRFFEKQVSPTSRSDIVAVTVHGHHFYIPANYFEYEQARQGGVEHDVHLFGLDDPQSFVHAAGFPEPELGK